MFYHFHVKLWVQTRQFFGMNGYCRPRRRVFQILREECAEKIDEEVLRACAHGAGSQSSRNKPSAVFFLMGLTWPKSHMVILAVEIFITGFEIIFLKKGGVTLSPAISKWQQSLQMLLWSLQPGIVFSAQTSLL